MVNTQKRSTHPLLFTCLSAHRVWYGGGEGLPPQYSCSDFIVLGGPVTSTGGKREFPVACTLLRPARFILKLLRSSCDVHWR